MSRIARALEQQRGVLFVIAIDHDGVEALTHQLLDRGKGFGAPQCRIALGIQCPLMRLPLWLKLLWTACVIAWIPLYWRQYGPQNFLYFCDLGNMFICAGLWLESPLIFSWQATGLLLFQTLFTIDLAGALVSGRHLIGGTEFMFDPLVPLGIRLLSLFHVVTPPLLLWAIRRLGSDPRGWKYQTLTAWIVVPITYSCLPEYDLNWAPA